MGRKQIIQPFTAVDAGNLSDASITGSETNVEQTDVAQYVAIWSGGQATNGDLKVQGYLNDITGWFDLDFGATISLDGASGNHQLIIQQVSFKKIRPVYTRTNASASGSLNIVVFATTKGA